MILPFYAVMKLTDLSSGPVTYPKNQELRKDNPFSSQLMFCHVPYALHPYAQGYPLASQAAKGYPWRHKPTPDAKRSLWRL